MKTNVVRGMLAALTAASLFLDSAAALADEREQCASAADQAQQLRDEGKYRRAREQMLTCARDVCPGPIKRDCLEWLTQLENVAPTVVFAAKDGDKDLSDVKVSMDGTPVADHIDGRPVAVDIGEHVFRFDYHGTVKESKVLIGAGQKGRNITVVFGAPPSSTVPPGDDTRPPAEQPKGSSSLVPAFIVGGIGVVALGSFAFFGLSVLSDVSDLEKCKPNCAQSDVDSADSKKIIADVSLGVGIVALGVATYMFVTAPKETPTTGSATAKRTSSSGLRITGFDVGPVRGGGASASVAATF